LVPVRKETKARLARLKGGASYDALLRVLLDQVPRDEVERRLRGHTTPARRPEARERPPEKQLMIADLAARRWHAWLTDGRATQRGPRLYSWKTKEEAPRSVRYEWTGRRGLSP